MQYKNFEPKIRFSTFFPYGLASPHAVELCMEASPYEYTFFDPEVPMEDRLKALAVTHLRNLKGIEVMEHYGYTTSSMYKYGEKQYQKMNAIYLTRSALNLMTNTIDYDTEWKRAEEAKKGKNRYKRINTYLSQDEESISLRKRLYELGKSKDNSPEEAQAFDAAFLESVYYGEATLLAREPNLAHKVHLMPNASRSQRYRDFRLANINALFRNNSFLTALDRRPLDIALTQREVAKRYAEYEKLASMNKLDIKAFTDYVLYQWYQANPDSYYFNDPYKAMTVEAIEDWSFTPAFYALKDLPGYYTSEDELIAAGNAAQNLRHTCMGVAVGEKANYIVYHTQPVKTPWIANVEGSTAESIQMLLNEHSGKYATIGGSRSYKNAIMVCPNITQFANLFDKARTTAKKKTEDTHIVGSPYENVNIIPMNFGGLCSIRHLMFLTPFQAEEAIKNELLHEYPTIFSSSGNPLFPLSHNNTPVLLAYTMNYQKLYWACEHYHRDTKFYVMCFPSQVKFIRKIMPDVEFL